MLVIADVLGHGMLRHICRWVSLKKNILKEVDTVHSLFVTHEGQMAKTRSSRDGKNI